MAAVAGAAAVVAESAAAAAADAAAFVDVVEVAAGMAAPVAADRNCSRNPVRNHLPACSD